MAIAKIQMKYIHYCKTKPKTVLNANKQIQATCVNAFLVEQP